MFYFNPDRNLLHEMKAVMKGNLKRQIVILWFNVLLLFMLISGIIFSSATDLLVIEGIKCEPNNLSEQKLEFYSEMKTNTSNSRYSVDNTLTCLFFVQILRKIQKHIFRIFFITQ